MMTIIKSGTKFDFVGKFPITSIISCILVAAGIFSIVTKMGYGVDFRGGAEIQVKFKTAIVLDHVRGTLKKAGFPGVVVQSIGEASENEFLVKVAAKEGILNEVTQKVKGALQTRFSKEGAEIRKVDIVGPKAGANLRVSGFQAMLWALLAIMVYIGLRFEFKYSPGAIVALLHDVSIILGIFALTGTEFTLQTVAAILAVIGYSVNDTVIVYDRVREHEERDRSMDLKLHINNALNETLSRTVLTSGTTLFISLAMYFFGGLAIRDFFFAISLGVIIGTYSSLFVAAPVTLFLDRLNKSNTGGQEAGASA